MELVILVDTERTQISQVFGLDLYLSGQTDICPGSALDPCAMRTFSPTLLPAGLVHFSN